MAVQGRSWIPGYERRINRRKFLVGAASAAGAAALIACGGSGGSEKPLLTIDPSGVRKTGAVVYQQDNWKLADETDQAVAGGIYPGRLAADLTSSWDPFLAVEPGIDEFTNRGYEYLVKANRGPGIEPGSDEYREIAGVLAESFEVSNDASVYTFTMRRGVKFQPTAPVNGREMTIEDWKATYERFSQVGANRARMAEQVDKIEFPDNRHMVVKMKQPYGIFLTLLLSQDYAFKIVPRELVMSPDLIATRMIGSGHQMVDKVQPSITQEFKRFDEYWGGKPFIDRWHYPIIPEYANAYSQFVAQNIISFSPNARDALKLRSDAPNALMVANEINQLATPYSSFGKPGLESAPWKDSRVRIALNRIIDWDAILAFQSNRDAFKAAGIDIVVGFNTHAPRDPSYWLDPRKGELGDASKNYLYDPVDAKRLLEASGYSDGFEIQVNAQVASNEEAIRLANDFYTKSGLIRIKENWMQRQEYFDNVVYGTAMPGMSGTSSGAGDATDIDHILANQHETGGRQNVFSDPKMDEMIKLQRRQTDPEKRAEILKDWQKYIATQFYSLPRRHVFNAWSFEWLWLHNVNQPGHLQWLDGNMPRRNG